MTDLTLGQSDISVVISDNQPAGNTVVLVNSDSGYSLATYEGSRGQKAASNSIPVVIATEQSVQGSLINGQSTIGLSAVQLSSNSLKQGVVIKASSSNTGIVYIGNSSGVTTSSGFELGAGESVTIPINNTNLVYLIANASGQSISFVGN